MRIRKRSVKGGEPGYYYYHRPTMTRIWNPPGTEGFQAELDRLNHSPACRAAALAQKASGRTVKPTRIYFVQGAITQLVKIGKAARPMQRLVDLQCGSPDRLLLLGTIEDKSGGLLEIELHVKFGEHRLHGEWFHPAPELLEYVATRSKPPRNK